MAGVQLQKRISNCSVCHNNIPSLYDVPNKFSVPRFANALLRRNRIKQNNTKSVKYSDSNQVGDELSGAQIFIYCRQSSIDIHEGEPNIFRYEMYTSMIHIFETKSGISESSCHASYSRT